jgi:16S rRNA (guanine527-N7)-methyltransferase
VRYGLDDRQGGQLGAILQGLTAVPWSPTAVRDPVTAVDVHLADSLVALDIDALQAAQGIADLGAGAGFPGLALAVALPRSSLSLVESQARKCLFMEKLCARAEIPNAHVVCARAEEWVEGLGNNDVVLARALAGMAVVLEYAAPLLRVGGMLVDWRGRRDRVAEGSALRAAQLLGLQLAEIRRVEPFEGARNHHLHLYVKDRETPEGFPRRAGMARKRPLAS